LVISSWPVVAATFDFEQIRYAEVNGEVWRNAFYGSGTHLSVTFGDVDNDGDLDLEPFAIFNLFSK